MAKHLCYGCMSIVEGELCQKCGWHIDQKNEPHQLPVGIRLRDQYIIGKVLGQGGFGITYLGWDDSLDMPVAIKEFFPNMLVTRDTSIDNMVRCISEIMREQYEANLDRFLREAKALAKLRDVPEVVGVHGFFRENNTAYIIMEYVKGTDLANYVAKKGGKLTADETFRILRPIMEALDKVHQLGLVHRDISPDNIILHPTGGAKLLDFGAVRSLEGGANKSTEAILKHGFAPIEQYQSRGELGPWSDEYALCASIYYCLSGRVPEEASVRTVEGIDIDFEFPGLEKHQQEALSRGMKIRPSDRFSTVGDLISALFGVQASDASVLMDAMPESVKVRKAEKDHPKRRHRNKLWIMISSVAILTVALILWLIPNGWQETAEGWMYFRFGMPLKNEWLTTAEGTYYLDATGHTLVGIQTVDEKKYYFDDDGQMVTGWVGDYYFAEDGTITIGWAEIDGETYYFRPDGIMAKSWQEIGIETYYFLPNGVLAKGWQEIGEETYYFLVSGTMARGWQNIDGKRYHFGENGLRTCGDSIYIDGEYYCFDDNGVMLTGWHTVIGTGTVYLGTDGVRRSEWQDIDGDRYYFRINGMRTEGFYRINGTKYYFGTDGKLRTNCWLRGSRLTANCVEEYNNPGELQYFDVYYYADDDGALVVGWKNIRGDRYYFGMDGKMCTRGMMIDGLWYDFGPDGKVR